MTQAEIIAIAQAAIQREFDKLAEDGTVVRVEDWDGEMSLQATDGSVIVTFTTTPF